MDIEERECRMCGNDIEGNRCDVCGYYNLDRSIREDREREIAASMRDYRHVKLPEYDIRVSLIGYRWMEDGEEIRPEDPDGEVLFTFSVNEILAETEKRGPHIVWDRKHPFAQTEGCEEITLTCEFSYGKEGQGCRQRRCTMELPAPKTEGPWYVGMMLERGFYFRFYVGNPDSDEYKNTIMSPLLSKKTYSFW